MTQYPIKWRWLILGVFCALSMSCGGTSEGDEVNDPDPVPSDPVLGNSWFSLENAVDERDNGNFEPDEGSHCDKDVGTGLFHVKFTDDSDALELRIKNFQSDPRDYKCRQPANNTGSDSTDDLGDLYDTCMVSVRAQPADVDGMAGYDMHRFNTSLSPFSYKGDCVITIESVGSEVTGSVDCRAMIQTYRDGSLRNPVSEEVKSDVKGGFSCDLRKL